MSKSTSNGRSVLMLKLADKDYEFFGSAGSLYDKYGAELLGISQGALNNYFSKHKPEDADGTVTYTNSKCIIVKGTLYTKSDNRGRKEYVLF